MLHMLPLIMSCIQVADNHWSDKRRLTTAAVVNHLDTLPFEAIFCMCSFKKDDDGADSASKLDSDQCVPIRYRFRIGKSRFPIRTLDREKKNLLAWARIMITGRQV